MNFELSNNPRQCLDKCFRTYMFYSVIDYYLAEILAWCFNIQAWCTIYNAHYHMYYISSDLLDNSINCSWYGGWMIILVHGSNHIMIKCRISLIKTSSITKRMKSLISGSSYIYPEDSRTLTCHHIAHSFSS